MPWVPADGSKGGDNVRSEPRQPETRQRGTRRIDQTGRLTRGIQTYSEIQLAEVISKKNKSKSETENQPGLKSHFLRMFSSYATSTATKKIDHFFKSEMQKTTTNVTTTNSPQPGCHKSLPASSLHWWRWAPSTKLQSCPPDARPKCSVDTWFFKKNTFSEENGRKFGQGKKNGFFF